MRRYPLLALLALLGCSFSPSADPGPAAPAASSAPTVEAESAASVEPAPPAEAAEPEPAADTCAGGDARACLALCMAEATKCGDDKDECDRVADAVPECSGDAIELGSLCVLEAAEIAPTQGAVGKVSATCRAAKITGKNTRTGNKLERYLLARPVPAVYGPGERFFITDRHHLSWGVLNADIQDTPPDNRKKLFICQMADKSSDAEGPFWEYMESNNFAWLRDRKGNRIAYAELPKKLEEVGDDPYRTLSRWVRDSCGFIKCDDDCDDGYPGCKGVTSQYYLEFVWGDYMRIPLAFPDIYDKEGKEQVEVLRPNLSKAIGTALSPDANQLPGWNNGTVPADPIPIDDLGCEE